MTKASWTSWAAGLFLIGCGEQSIEPVQGGPDGGGVGGSSAGSGGAGGVGGSTGGNAGSGGSSAGGSAGGGPTITVYGQVGEYPLGGVGIYPLVPGLEVCVFEKPAIPCATTDAEGFYDLPGVPAQSEVGITFKKTGYTPYLGLLTTKSESVHYRVMLLQADQSAAKYAELAQFSGPPTSKAWVTVCGGLFLGDVTMSLTPNAGVKGPVYWNNQTNLPDLTVLATSYKQGCALFEAAPGDYEASVSHPTLSNCGPFPIHWPGKDAKHAKVRAVTGFHTMVEFNCQ